MKKAEKIFYTLCVLFFIWLIASYINCINHNLSDYNYASWNLLENFNKVVQGVQG